jgi:hypothetical protein
MLARAGIRPTGNGLVNVHITIPDFKVVTTLRIGANPSLVMNRCPLTAKIRQGHQVSRITLLAFRKTAGLFHEDLLPTDIL